jgi:hypothetical protein
MKSVLDSRPILMKLDFLKISSKNTHISNFMKICTWEPSSIRTDVEANSRFSQFCEGAYQCNTDITPSVILYCPEFGGLKSLTNTTFNNFDHGFDFLGPHIHVSLQISNLHFSIRVKVQISPWRNLRGKINYKRIVN